MTLSVSTIESKAIQLADATSGDFSTVNDVVGWVNESQREIVKQTECLEELLSDTTDAATTAYDLPADFWKEKRVEYDGDKCDFVEFDQFKHLLEDEATVDRTKYTIWDGQIEFYTGDTIVADVTYKIWYFKFAADVTGSASTTGIPDKYSDAIPYYVASMMAETNADFSLAERRMTQFYNRISMTRKDVRRTRRGANRVKVEIVDKYSL